MYELILSMSLATGGDLPATPPSAGCQGRQAQSAGCRGAAPVARYRVRLRDRSVGGCVGNRAAVAIVGVPVARRDYAVAPRPVDGKAVLAPVPTGPALKTEVIVRSTASIPSPPLFVPAPAVLPLRMAAPVRAFLEPVGIVAGGVVDRVRFGLGRARGMVCGPFGCR